LQDIMNRLDPSRAHPVKPVSFSGRNSSTRDLVSIL
jgi:hypothetical protein